MTADSSPASQAGPAAPNSRIASIDLIRGAVMILMAIDHVRVYSGVPAGGPAPGVFFTRWVTHFCAPAFLFLAGTSAFFYGRKHNDLSRHLLTRGAWLVFLELTVLRMAWTFNLDFAHYEMAGVIWVIGWCMILLAGLARLPLALVGTVGVLIIAGHNLIDPYLGELIPALGESGFAALWKILYLGFFAGPNLPDHRPRRHHALPGAPGVQPLWRSAPVGSRRARPGGLAADAGAARVPEHQ
jgi:hypothetical protein